MRLGKRGEKNRTFLERALVAGETSLHYCGKKV